MVLEGGLVATRDHQHVVEPGGHRLLHDVLDGRLVHDGSISLGMALVAGRNRVPRPATGMTALEIVKGIALRLTIRRTPRLVRVPDAAESEKRALRAQIRERRRIRTSTERASASAAITQHLIDLATDLKAQSISAYLSLPDEPGTRDFVAWACDQDLRVCSRSSAKTDCWTGRRTTAAMRSSTSWACPRRRRSCSVPSRSTTLT
jgi:hypothetical protein